MKKLLTILFAVVTLQAHHGWAAFDHSKTLTFQGTVTAFRFLNPHSVVEFTAKDPNGKVISWQGELTSASRLSTKGWAASSLAKGDEINISGYPAHDVNIIRISKLTLASGKPLTILMDN
ncbi:MAG: DUF6152 family protein [Bryobacteraceae bacterium]